MLLNTFHRLENHSFFRRIFSISTPNRASIKSFKKTIFIIQKYPPVSVRSMIKPSSGSLQNSIKCTTRRWNTLSLHEIVADGYKVKRNPLIYIHRLSRNAYWNRNSESHSLRVKHEHYHRRHVHSRFRFNKGSVQHI